MEPMVDSDKPEGRSENVGEKRPATEDVDALRGAEDFTASTKRIKGEAARKDVKKVAEMVMVLAAMGKMRGGKGPTDVEKELMGDARNKLAKICEGFAPNEVFPKDAFGGLIEDLGLNKLKEQRIGFRPPKLSISDKLLFSRRKMEKADHISRPPSAPSFQVTQGNPGVAVGSCSASHPVQLSHVAKLSHKSTSPGNFQSISPLTRVSASNSFSWPYQLPTSEVRSLVSNVLPLGSAALPRPHLRSDGGSNGPVYPSQVQANYSANSMMRAATWSVQPQTVSLAKTGQDNKMVVNMSPKVEGAAGVKSGLPTQSVSRSAIAQTAGVSHGSNYVQNQPVTNAHAEIVKIVQKILKQQVSDHPTWNPPSRDYMSKALTCHMCMSMVTDIDNILICDGCEKGFHLKCLQTINRNGVSRGEWHCRKCLFASNGKPPHPKYGRVMRNTNAMKVSSNTSAVLSDSSKTIVTSHEVGQPKTTNNCNTPVQNVPPGVAGIEPNYQIPRLRREDVKGIQVNDNVSSMVKADDEAVTGTYPNNLMKNSLSAFISPANLSAQKSSDDKLGVTRLNTPAKLEMMPNLSDNLKELVIAQNGNRRVQNNEVSKLKKTLENHVMGGDSNESHHHETSNNMNLLKEQEALCSNLSEVATSAGTTNHDGSSYAGLQPVNWVGDPTQVLDDKIYYASCRINGHSYKATDHVLFHSDNDKLVPGKLQAMWEDRNTSVKWVTVNKCYFPGDLPEAVGRPCGAESSEVYESTCGTTMMAGLIESPCEVLPPKKFAEESERRTCTGAQLTDCLPPIYLCKWIYDVAKGLFRDISC